MIYIINNGLPWFKNITVKEWLEAITLSLDINALATMPEFRP